MKFGNRNMGAGQQTIELLSGGGDVSLDPPTLIESVTINADGWTIDVVTVGEPDGTFSHGTPSSPNFALTVSSKSWTIGGVETTKTRTVFVLSTMRQPYPNQASRQQTDNTPTSGRVTTRFSLNDYIYADDTITEIVVASGWFTNDGTGGDSSQNTLGDAITLLTDNSTVAYPKPALGWLEAQLEWVQAASFSPKLAVFHKYGEQANQVRAVKFSATDGTNTVEAFATSMSSETGSVSGLTYSYYTASISLSTLNAEAVITVDATIYPWVGDEYQITVDGFSYPNRDICPLKFLNDKNSTYGEVYAYVDATSGNNGTGVASANPATAQASPFQTIGAAAAAARTQNNSLYGRNNTSGCIIRLEADTYTSLGDNNMDTLADGDVPLIIAAANPANKATTIISRSNSSNMELPNLVRFEDLSFTTGGGIPFDGGSTVQFSNQYFFIDCDFASTASSVTGIIYRGDLITMIGCQGANLHNGSFPGPFSTTIHRPVLLLNSDIHVSQSGQFFTFCIYVGNKLRANASTMISSFRVNSATPNLGNNGVIAFNKIIADDKGIFEEADLSGIQAYAVCGNVIESADVQPDPIVQISSEEGNVIKNVIFHHNTVVGARTNILYTSAGNTVDFVDISVKASIFWRLNMKSDIFDTDGTKDQNWAVRHRVGCSYISTTHGDSNLGDTSTPGPSSWIAEISGVGEGLQVSPDYTDDNSTTTGDSTGDGNYQPGSLNDLEELPATLVPWPKDIGGNTYAQDGTDLIGAYCVAI